MNNKKISIFKFLFSLLKGVNIKIFFAILFGYLGHLVAIFILVGGSFLISNLVQNTEKQYLYLTGIIILFGLSRGLFRYLEQYLNHYIAFKILAKIRSIIFEKLRILGPYRLSDDKNGSLLSLLTADIETIEVFYAHTISPLFIAILTNLTIMILLLIFSNYIFVIITLISYIFIGFITPYIAYKFINKNSLKYRDELANFNSYFLDQIKGIEEIVINDKENLVFENIKDKSNKLNEKNIKIKKQQASFSSITNLFILVTVLVSLMTGIYLVSINTVKSYDLVVVLVLIFSSFGPSVSLSLLPQTLSQSLSSAKRIQKLLLEKPILEDVNNKKDIEKFELLEVNNLSFKYNQEDKDFILDNFNLKIKKGEILGIKGKSGIGKTTFSKLIMHFYKPQKGSIKINGIDLNEINTLSLRKLINIVSQDTYLFNDTIFNNLKIADINLTLNKAKDACKKAQIDEFIESLDKKYYTEVGQLGKNLSAGEKQRLQLARAFLYDSEFIIFDEPTSNLDYINEAFILQSIKNHFKGKTIIIISHRETTLSICDRIINFEN